MPRPKTPEIAVDIIIEMVDRENAPIVLIERRFPPPGWAVPGGFVDVGETVEDAARREALEETGLHVSLKTLLGCYSDPSRDSRGHTVSMVYIAEASGEPMAADDAANVRLFQPDQIDVALAFDHAEIISHYLRYRATGELPAPR